MNASEMQKIMLISMENDDSKYGMRLTSELMYHIHAFSQTIVVNDYVRTEIL